MSAPKIEQKAVLTWIRAGDIRVSHEAQRDFKQSRTDRIVANFDPDAFGHPTVNYRGDVPYAVDGQHRVKAAIELFGEDVLLECWTHYNLTEPQEAELFLVLNDTYSVHAMDKFHVGVAARRNTEVEVEKIASKHGLTIGHKTSDGGKIAAVGKVIRIYERDGEQVLDDTLGTIVDAFGDAGLTAQMIGGVALFHARYGDADKERLRNKLKGVRGGSNGILGLARQMRVATRRSIAECVAAVVTQQYNKGLRGRAALPAWWRE